ncbi:MAG: TIGR02449 family protein [Endozoicomonas sp. (ex Botrylloides leachii)]|nr:TIGR02449 family protein [Endozoicomonas sp. (ex Botrylloides leachii)]
MIVLTFSSSYSKDQEPTFQDAMDTPNFSALDQKIENLLSLCQKLKKQNAQLRAREERLQAERQQLIGKNAIARARVEAMISSLKTLEQE